jgi:hypothetical protein
MRIVGNIPHNTLKITVFKHDNKYSVKLETGLYEQIYKFRDGEADTFSDVKTIIDEPFIEAVSQEIQRMHRLRMEAIARLVKVEASEFEEII